ncbi:hypothetical protein [Stenoxybacter acetivorans]|uniref:hypothetical protein n=1 Tax=Stenoxybacter acetivorans TaxID=422441 RepID=UPI0005621A40|nr:hypothetical protein [Stenoxybacter acetivorans]
MSALPKAFSQTPNAAPVRELCRWYMLVNGNQHRHDLCLPELGLDAPLTISEALIPQVRMVAALIAAERLDFQTKTPDIITEEADWFAARILIFGVRVFHLDITLMPMLKCANQRAKAFAAKHGLAFQAAQMRMSLHAARPQQMLIMETETTAPQDLGVVGNSLSLRRAVAAQFGCHTLFRQ